MSLDAPGAPDEPAAAHRQKLALLTVLALADRPLSRDALIGLFWADQDERRARHSLSNALSSLRRVLGPKAIRRHRDEVVLEPGLALEVDAVELARSGAAGDWAAVVGRYRGPFLNGVFVGGTAEFEHWADGHRSRLEGLFLEAAAHQATALAAAGDWERAAQLSRRWLEAAPLSTEAAGQLLDALTAAGTRDGDQRALEAYDRLVTLLGEQYGRRPDRAITARAQAIIARLRGGDATAELPVPTDLLAEASVMPTPTPGAGAVPATPAAVPGANESAVARSAVAEPTVAEPETRPASVKRRWWLIAPAAALVAALGWWAATRGEPAAPARGAGVAIGAIRAPADSASAWLADGLVQMIGARLARSPSVEVVAPDRLRELLPERATLSDLLAAAERVGARWAVSGSVTRSEQGFLMDVNVHDVAEGRLASLGTVSASDPIALADLAAVRVLNAAGTSAEGATLAEFETANPGAFEHFARFVRATDEGRPEAAIAALDAAIAADSGFVSALRERAMIAFPRGEQAVLQALLAAFERNASRATEYDRLMLASQAAFYGGQHSQSEALAEQLVAHYPRDPRALGWQLEVLILHGRWTDARTVIDRLLALDSTTVGADGLVCVPCRAYGNLVDVSLLLGDLPGAERAARRLTALAPHLTLGWDKLAVALTSLGRYDEALAAIERGKAIGGQIEWAVSQEVRIYMMTRDFERAEQAIRALRQEARPQLQPLALDLSMMLARERGRYRASIATYDSLERLGERELRLVAANGLGRIGEYRRARALYDAPPPVATPPNRAGLRAVSLVGDIARAFSWQRALEADAIAPSRDTVRLRRIADSLEQLSRLSYYGRDWRLHHHVLGLLLAIEERHEAAASEFKAARWGTLTWTRPHAEEAKSLLASGRPDEAIDALRVASASHLEAMGRYLPRSELDFLMALAFRQAGRVDSSRVYEAYVRKAWADADPEVRALLGQLGGALSRPPPTARSFSPRAPP
ncbi:MAG: BTAD domain-containing putative transcriptional regulator [Gemmatimonadales bacterium]